MRVFVAGGSGVVGRRLVPLLVADGHQVTATTRTPERVGHVRALGAEPVLLDALDAGSVGEAVARAEPDVLVHELTALAGAVDLRRFDAAFARTNELRTRGTDNLLAAAEAVGVRRFVAQSFTGWTNARNGWAVKTEEDPLDADPPAAQRRSLDAILHLERAVTAAPLEGVVLRYGTLYGPGTAISNEVSQLVRRRRLPIVGDGDGIWSFVHVDDAAAATAAAVAGGPPGVYNVVDDDPAPVRTWLPHLARCLDAPPPRRVPRWVGRLAVGEVGVSMMTAIRGSSNAKAKLVLGWEPRWRSWREGFRYALHEPALPGGQVRGGMRRAA
jgi:nucleoside-diphosphate-sugar epimerase